MTTTTPDISVRPATPADVPEIHRLLRGLAAFGGGLDRLSAREADLLRDGFGDRPVFEVLLAERAGRAVGYALFFPNYSTWEGRPGLYVEDLFVEEAARGTGAGRRLLAAVAAIARARGYARVELSVVEWNPARAFYGALGFAEKAEWRLQRLDGEALDRLAGDDPIEA
ncbi:MAG: GNAT family N-acetyltransferase [Azospirillaceae bacterium]